MTSEEIERMRRRKQRIQIMKAEKQKAIRRQQLIKKLLPIAGIVFVILIAGGIGIHSMLAAVSDTERTTGSGNRQSQAADNPGNTVYAAESSAEAQPDENEQDVPGLQQGEGAEASAEPLALPVVSTKQYSARETEKTVAPPSEVDSSNVIFLARESGDILAARDCHTVINPASMTKVLTILVAAEHVTNLDDTFVITPEITDYSYVHDCSVVGFEKEEQVTVRDLFYGTILPSGGDAAVGLATYVAGSHEAFVDLMNEKLEILGLSDTAHFTNCVGIYDKEHHCTVYDMAMIMEAALDNELCKEILSAHTYTTSATTEHPEGLLISNWFLRRIEDQDTGGEVVCGKTGFVDQSGNCCVSFGVDGSGNEYICATTGAHGSWRCIYDHAALYKKYAKNSE